MRNNKNLVVMQLLQAYNRVKYPLAQILLITAGIYGAFGEVKIAAPALIGLGSIILELLFAIGLKQEEFNFAEKFLDFEDASLDIQNTINQVLSSKEEVEIQWIGTAMQKGATFLMDKIEPLLEKNPDKTIKLEIFMLSSSCDQIKYLNEMWPSLTEKNYDTLNKWKRKTNNSRIDLNICQYQFPPMYTGLLIDGRILYLAHGSWENNGQQAEYSVGKHPHYKYETRSPKGTEYIRQYQAWIKYIVKLDEINKTSAPTPQDSSPPLNQPESSPPSTPALLHELLQGNNVTIVPIHQELTTKEAADILNISCQYLIELLEAQAIPYSKVGTHHRIRFGDLMDYKNDRDAKRREGLSQMTKKSQKLGLYTKAANTPEDQQTPGE